MSRAAIEEYCRICQQRHNAQYSRTTSDERQEAMLEELVERSKSDFGRSFAANLAADATYDIIKIGLKGLTKIL